MKPDKIKELCITNLTYYRLQADLAAVKLEITDNAPVMETAETNLFKKLWSKAKTLVNNELRKKTTDELKKDLAAAEAELARFESIHTAKELQLSQNPAKLKSFIYKKLFKKDTDGLKRMNFALALILDNRYTYQRPAFSLQVISQLLFEDAEYMQGLYDTLYENFKYLHNDLIPSMDELLSMLPSMGNVSLQALVNRHKQRNFKKSLDRLSADQAGAILAIKLTVVEKAKTILSKEAWEDLIDETLRFIGDVRADAEYEKVFQIKPADVAEEILRLCSLAVDRLTALVGE